MKAIKRSWVNDYDYSGTDEIQGEALFIATGEAPNGKLFYSMLNSNGDIEPENKDAFMQIRHDNKLIMVRI